MPKRANKFNIITHIIKFKKSTHSILNQLTDVTPLAKEKSQHDLYPFQHSYNAQFTLFEQSVSHSVWFATPKFSFRLVCQMLIICQMITKSNDIHFSRLSCC